MQDDQDKTKADFSEMKSGVMESGEKIGATIGAAKHDLSDKARDIASEGKEALTDKAEAVQRNLSSAIAAFSEAVRVASEHLSNSDQKGVARYALEAAGGLERMSVSLKDKPFEDVLTEIRHFGARNPGVLVGGSVIAGLALGRFIKSSSSTGEPAKNGGASNDATQFSGQESDQ
jgi:hypothetical protein